MSTFETAVNEDSNGIKVVSYPDTNNYGNWVTPVYLKCCTLTEQKTHSDALANIITFSAVIYGIEIYHEEDTWQSFTVNGLTLHVPSGGYRTMVGGTASATVVIPSINCIVGRLT